MKDEQWFVLVPHVLKGSVSRGTVVRNVRQEDSTWFYTIYDHEHKTHYGWALARDTEENRRLAERYWKLEDASEIIKTEKDLLFSGIEKAEEYENDGPSEE